MSKGQRTVIVLVCEVIPCAQRLQAACLEGFPETLSVYFCICKFEWQNAEKLIGIWSIA